MPPAEAAAAPAEPSLRSLLLVLCAFQALLHAKPSEPHLVPYLVQVKHFSEAQVVNSIFPVYTYATLLFTVLAAPASQRLGCKLCVVAGSGCRLATRLFLLFATSLPAMQFMQVLFGAGVAAEVVFNGYVFTLVGPQRYQLVSSAASAAALVGYLLAAELGQLAVQDGASLTSLFWASLVTVGAGAALSLALPPGPPSPARAGGLLDSALAALRQPLRTPQLRLLSGWWLAGGTALAFAENFGMARLFELRPDIDGSGHATALARTLAAAAAATAVWAEPACGRAGARLYAAICLPSAALALMLAGSATLAQAYASYAFLIAALSFAQCVLYAQCAHALDDADTADRSAERSEETEHETLLEWDQEELPPPPPPQAPQEERHRPAAAALFAANSAACLLLQSLIQVVIASRGLSAAALFRLLAGFLVAVAAATAAAGAQLRGQLGTWRLVSERGM